jgi:predicted phage tail protein
MIKVNLHGKLGKDIGESWDLEVSSVAEAFRAIEANSRKLRKWIINNSDDYKYEILINKNNIFSEDPNNKSTEELRNSELFINLDDKIQTIDIVPCIVGAGFISNFFNSGLGKVIGGTVGLIGAVLVGVIFPPLLPLAVGVGIASLGLIAAGTSELLSKPPPNVPFTAQQVNPIGGDNGGPTSYLFNGPVNTVGEGGPVPVGYGKLLIGGNNVYANYDIVYRAYRSVPSSTTNQVIDAVQGDQYTFNSQCYLINQTSLSNTWGGFNDNITPL